MIRPPAWSSIIAKRARGRLLPTVESEEDGGRVSFASRSEPYKQKDCLSPWNVLRLVFKEWED